MEANYVAASEVAKEIDCLREFFMRLEVVSLTILPMILFYDKSCFMIMIGS